MIAEPGTSHGTGRRRIGAAAATLVAALTLSACAAGQIAQTANEKASLDGTNVSVGSVDLRGLAILPPSSTSYASGSNIAVKVVLVNSGKQTDALTGITSAKTTGWSAYQTLAVAKSAQAAPAGTSAPTGSQSVSLAPGTRTAFGTPEAKGGLVLLGTKGALYPGTTVSLTFTFQHAGSITVPVPIQVSTTPGQDATIQPASSQPAE